MDLDLSNLIDWRLVGDNAAHIVAALLLALPLGLNRERAEALGLRTIPLVAVAACGFLLMGRSVWGDAAEPQARLLAGLISGVGFLGGGAILKSGDHVRGTATAASIWNTAAIGAAVATDRFEIAILLALINVGILIGFSRISKKLGPQDQQPEESAELGAPEENDEGD